LKIGLCFCLISLKAVVSTGFRLNLDIIVFPMDFSIDILLVFFKQCQISHLYCWKLLWSASLSALGEKSLYWLTDSDLKSDLYMNYVVICIRWIVRGKLDINSNLGPQYPIPLICWGLLTYFFFFQNNIILQDRRSFILSWFTNYRNKLGNKPNKV
jgi:hypothetical protein